MVIIHIKIINKSRNSQQPENDDIADLTDDDLPWYRDNGPFYVPRSQLKPYFDDFETGKPGLSSPASLALNVLHGNIAGSLQNNHLLSMHISSTFEFYDGSIQSMDVSPAPRSPSAQNPNVTSLINVFSSLTLTM